jgi:hypothetical protein
MTFPNGPKPVCSGAGAAGVGAAVALVALLAAGSRAWD